MRKLMAGLSLGVALGMAAPLRADYPGPSTYEKDPALSSSHRMTTAEQRIYERATIEAHERLARIESRHRNGISAQRPAIYYGAPGMPENVWSSPWHYYRWYPYACP
jgi:hypothetical protein